MDSQYQYVSFMVQEEILTEKFHLEIILTILGGLDIDNYKDFIHATDAGRDTYICVIDSGVQLDAKNVSSPSSKVLTTLTYDASLMVSMNSIRTI